MMTLLTSPRRDDGDQLSTLDPNQNARNAAADQLPSFEGLLAANSVSTGAGTDPASFDDNPTPSEEKPRRPQPARSRLREVLAPPSLPIRENFIVLQKWHGYVVTTSKDTFVAMLSPIVGEGSDQEAEIYLNELAPDDQPLVEPGAVFYWSIGYFDRPSGRARMSVIRFRRSPMWEKNELDRASKGIARLRAILDGE